MLDFYTKQGSFIYDTVKNDFKFVYNEEVVLQRLTNALSIFFDQWKPNPDIYIDYKTLMESGDLNLILDTIRNKIVNDRNVGGFQSMTASFSNNILNITISLFINGVNYTIRVNL